MDLIKTMKKQRRKERERKPEFFKNKGLSNYLG
jgi:hypothetical protein